MAEASTRVLLDRDTIRVDGRPFFAFAARLLCPSMAGVPDAVGDLARAGFTAVMTPPVNQQSLPVVEAIFNEAERLGMLVVVDADPGLANAAGFLASRFKHRPALHSYCLRPGSADGAGFDAYIEQRDHLRAMDLFHPIWTPCPPGVPVPRWLATVDLCAAPQRVGGPAPRQTGDSILSSSRTLSDAQRGRAGSRPLFCHAFQAAVADEVLRAGLYDFDDSTGDGGVLPGGGRWALMAPEPDLLRPRFYECLAARARGIVVDHYDALGGRVPFSGRDRFCELAVLAREAQVLGEFLAEGREVESGAEIDHPRLRSTLIHHGEDVLALVWRDAPGDEFWLDDTAMPNVEFRLRIHPDTPVTAWRLDFPEVVQLDLDRRWKDSVRVLLGEVDLTAVVLVTRGERRVRDLGHAVRDALEPALSATLEGLETRLAKVRFVESELGAMGEGTSRPGLLASCALGLEEARALADQGNPVAAWRQARLAMRRLRGVVNARMMEALGVQGVDPASLTELLRRSYYTLPPFYRMVRTGNPREGFDFT